jgi:hypothetical protein
MMADYVRIAPDRAMIFRRQEQYFADVYPARSKSGIREL